MDSVLHGQENTESLGGALNDIRSTEEYDGEHEGGGMGTLGNGLEDGGKGTIWSELDRGAVGGILLKKRGGRVACRGRMWSESWPLG